MGYICKNYGIYLEKLWDILGKNDGINWSIGYIKRKLRDVLGKIMGYIRQKLCDILWDIFAKALGYI